MTKYYVLIKKSKSRQWLGAIPAKKGTSLAKLRKVTRKQVKKGYNAKVVTESTLKSYLQKIRNRKVKTMTKISKKRRMVKRRHKKTKRRK